MKKIDIARFGWHWVP